MYGPCAAKPAPAVTGNGLRDDLLGGKIDPTDNAATDPKQAIRAELIGSGTCTAAGIAVTGSTPVLSLCRRLVATGHDPAQPLHVYRGAALALTVRSIGEAAELEIGGDGTTFRRHRQQPDAASLAQKSDPAGTAAWIDWPAAFEGAGSDNITIDGEALIRAMRRSKKRVIRAAARRWGCTPAQEEQMVAMWCRREGEP